MKEISCEALLVYLSEYIDNQLDYELTAVAQHHLATCENCRVMLDSTQKTITLFKEQEKEVISAERKTRLFNQLQDAFLDGKEPIN